jgi:glutamate-1-semialdehyde 2,1-aminomutase
VNLGITPDLTTLGKIIGGGYPVGAVGGRADLMNLLDPTRGRIFHSGTFNGNPVTTAAGVVSYGHLTSDAVTRMGTQAERLERSLAESAAGVGLPFSCRRVGSLLNVYFSDVAPAASLTREDAETMRLVHLAGMNHGLYFASRGLLVLSTVMSDEHLAEICSRFDAVFADVAAETLAQ